MDLGGDTGAGGGRGGPGWEETVGPAVVEGAAGEIGAEGLGGEEGEEAGFFEGIYEGGVEG